MYIYIFRREATSVLIVWPSQNHSFVDAMENLTPLFDIIPSLYVIFTQSAWPLVICLFQSVSSKAICPSVSSIATFVFYTRNLLLLKRGLLVEGNSLGRVEGQGWHLEREVHTSRWKKTHISQNGGRTFFEINVLLKYLCDLNFRRPIYFDKFLLLASMYCIILILVTSDNTRPRCQS